MNINHKNILSVLVNQLGLDTIGLDLSEFKTDNYPYGRKNLADHLIFRNKNFDSMKFHEVLERLWNDVTPDFLPQALITVTRINEIMKAKSIVIDDLQVDYITVVSIIIAVINTYNTVSILSNMLAWLYDDQVIHVSETTEECIEWQAFKKGQASL